MTGSFKLPDEEYNRLVGLQNRWNGLTMRYGELHYQKKSVEADLLATDTALEELDTERFNVVKELQEKYGVGHVNLITGEFTPETITEPTPAS